MNKEKALEIVKSIGRPPHALRPPVDRCIDGGHCFLMQDQKLPPCTKSCSIMVSTYNNSTWGHVKRLAAEGMGVYQRILARAQNRH